MTGIKRRHGGDSPNEVYSNKSRSRPSVEARVDPTYGQRSALPGLDDELRYDDEDGELDYGEEMDAMSYLRAVRHEAIGIPNLLVAPKEDFSGPDYYENGVGDYRGSYADGAYYAADSSSGGSVGQVAADGNLAYFDSIMERFEALRDQLQNNQPPPEALAKLDADHPTTVGALNTSVARWWRWKMRTVDPLPAQISSMDKGTVLRLLGLLSGGTLLKRGCAVEMGVSRWAWSLLARLPERGELTSEQIGVVRELGKKAVLVGMGLKEDAELNEGMDEVDPDYDDDEDDGEVLNVVNDAEIDLDLDEDSAAPDSSMLSIQTINAEGSFDSNVPDSDNTLQPEDTDDLAEALTAAKARLLGNLDEDVEEGMAEKSEPVARTPKWNTKATVDMIITVAGEAYGQRDLLEFRNAWDQIV
ncbi:hypothetical protein LSUE1_G009262 [Lachnellula suecica]|uniref:Uncharacterized protein n=1 Tax=Lachnellula suecica TaxID=602035 RepID=A0A8T9BWP0_9HELO|nr:hypothetical protein LSUE1_G009262 [Lachnellula suecica]